jgi:ArsR family transcriptional regulator
MSNINELFKVLSDETRLRIINLLMVKSLCVCELVEILDLSQPKISKHIAKLRAINLVTTKKNEQYIFYSIDKNNLAYNEILASVFKNTDYLLQNDIEKLKNIKEFVCTN